MSLTTRFGLVAGTTALAIAGTAFGGAESDNDALSQIAELKRELAELKQQDSQDWLTEQRASEIRGIVQDVLADAHLLRRAARRRNTIKEHGPSKATHRHHDHVDCRGNAQLSKLDMENIP